MKTQEEFLELFAKAEMVRYLKIFRNGIYVMKMAGLLPTRQLLMAIYPKVSRIGGWLIRMV